MSAHTQAPPLFDHLARLSDARGLFEHALLDEPRREHGYCVDDIARALIVVSRAQDPALAAMGESYLRFLEEAIAPDGRVRNRMDEHGTWTDRPALGDWWGRAAWALGFAAVHGPTQATRARAARAFADVSAQRSPHPKSMVFASLGAAEMLEAHPDHEAARRLLVDAMSVIGTPADRSWRWPEPRLSYASAAVAEALIAGGAALVDAALLERGLDALAFLLELELASGHLSVTGVTGRGPGDTGPQFDQQSIEVAALADACARALDVTGDPRWIHGITAARDWLHGANDTGVWMIDPDTGAGYDGLERRGRNENRGAESTLAVISTMQQYRRVAIMADAL